MPFDNALNNPRLDVQDDRDTQDDRDGNGIRGSDSSRLIGTFRSIRVSRTVILIIPRLVTGLIPHSSAGQRAATLAIAARTSGRLVSYRSIEYPARADGVMERNG